MIHFDRLRRHNYLPSWCGKMIASLISVAGIIIFIYFFIRMNYRLHYAIASLCFLLIFSGLWIWFVIVLKETNKSLELSFEKTRKQVLRLSWLSTGALYGCGICFFAGLMLIAQKSIWHYSLIPFTASISCLIIYVYALIQRKITKQHYEMKQKQHELIEMLDKLKQDVLNYSSEVG